jgi:hypothetical protein
VSALERLAETLRAQGGLLAGSVTGPTTPDFAAEPAAEAVEAIREGYELHYGTPRVVATTDADLALLAGDRLYALGLAGLAAAGDLDAVRTMAEVIAAAAAAHAAGDPGAARRAWAAARPAAGAEESPQQPDR